MALRRNQVPEIRVPKEAVKLESMGGDVVVYGLRLSDKLRFAAWDVERDGPRHRQMAALLAVAVRDGAGEPIWTEDDWDVWGGQNMADAVQLFRVAERLSGLDEAQAEKNLPPPRSDSP